MTEKLLNPPAPPCEHVKHPDHYRRDDVPFECIDLVAELDFVTGNICKYVWRHKRKNGVEDLRKALYYAENWYDPECVMERTGYTHAWFHNLMDAASTDMERRFWEAVHDHDRNGIITSLRELIEQEQ